MSRSIGHLVVRLGEVESTQDEAQKLLTDSNLGHGAVVMAERQTAGRGRGGRAWVQPGRALLVSIILRPQTPAALGPRLTSLAACGLLDALSGLGLPARVKWPNDLVLDVVEGQQPGPLGPFRKVGGILLTAIDLVGTSAESMIVDSAILGFGINLAPPTGGWPAELTDRATDLQEHGVEIEAEKMLSTCMSPLERWLGDAALLGDSAAAEGHFAQALDHLSRASATLHRRVRAPEEDVEGIAIELAPDGALVVETDDGERRTIMAGDVEMAMGAASPRKEGRETVR